MAAVVPPFLYIGVCRALTGTLLYISTIYKL